MWPVSSSWDNAVRNSQVIEVRVDAYRGGVLVASDLPIEPDSATITVDGTSDVRRTIDLTIADPALVPTAPTSVLTPHGTELRVTRGFRYPNGQTELIPVGVFRIDKPSTPLLGATKVTGVDYCRLLAEDNFLNPSQSFTTNAVPTEITRLIQLTQPGATVIDTTGNATPCALTNWEQDASRYDAIRELALSIGADVAPDALGRWIIRRLPEVTDAPVWSVNIGESGVLIGGDEDWDRENTFNGWTARGEPTTGAAPVQAFVADLDVSSPTYWGGPFGHRPKVFSSPLLATVGQCTATATTLLRRSIAGARAVRVQCIPNPALDYGDVLTLVLPGLTEESLPRSERHMIRSFTLPLALGAMEIDLTAPKPQ
jgi:hypothetical protein